MESSDFTPGRGVDNTPEGWLTDYLICFLMSVFAVRLRVRGASAQVIF